MIFKRIFLLILMCVTTGVFACDCVYNGPFAKVIHYAPVVAEVKIVEYGNFKMINDTKVAQSAKVEIVCLLKGKINQKTITIWGDNGNLCRPYVDTFQLEKKYVIALKSCRNNKAQQLEKDEDFFVDACGAYWLVADKSGNYLKGDIDGKIKEITLSQLKKNYFNK